MRVWLLTSEVTQEVAGGIARYVENFACLLGAAGHEVVVIARTEQERDKQIAPGVRLFGVPSRYARMSEANSNGLPDTHPAYPYNVLSYWPALSYQMAETVLKLLEHAPPPDILESQEYGAIPYYLLQRKLTERTPLTKIPILVHLHSPAFEMEECNQHPRYRFPEYWVGQMEKFCLVAADALLSPSTFLAQRVEKVLNRKLDIMCIPHPLTVHAEKAVSEVQPGNLVYVGRLEVRKGVLPLVRACSRLWARGEDFRLTLIGGDTDFMPRGTSVGTFLRQRYAKWIEDGHLQVAGQLDHAAVLAHVRRAWAVVVPSLWENFPNTCLEAMAVGQVVLASHAGGQAEMVETDGENGFLFDWHTPGDFEQKLHTALALDETARLSVGQRAQERIRTYCDPSTILAHRLQHYERVIAQHAPRRLFPTINAPEGAMKAEDSRSTVGSVESGARAELLSVVIPFYNLGQYLPETLVSIQGATYPSVEVVIVNDGSTEERSVAVLREIEKQGRVRIVHTENQGLATARNVGAEAAHGEFVAFVDADDLVEAEFFARAMDVLQRYPNVAFAYSWVRYFGESREIWPTWNVEFPYLLGHNMLTPLVVLRRSAFLNWAHNKPEVEYSLEDYEGWIGLVEAGGIGVSLTCPLVRYRVRSGSMYRSANRNQFLYLYDVITQHHPEAYRKWGVELFNLQNANGPGYLWNNPAVGSAEPPSAYVATVEQQRDKLLNEVQTLGKAWEDHVRFIAAQRTYIEDLEARCHELVATVHTNGTSPSTTSSNISWRDYELGGRLVSRIRRTWLARQALRSLGLKKVLKKTLGR